MPKHADGRSNVAIRRVYEPPDAHDGLRILVDRLWPRGLSKENAHVDHWLKDLAPSAALRKWFNHDPDRWVEFQKRYRAELQEAEPTLKELKSLVRGRKVTLLFGAKDEAHNNAVVLRDYLSRG